MSGIPAIRRPHTASVQEDWTAWLPNDTAQLFEHLRDDLAPSCAILGVIVNEALNNPSSGTSAALQQQLAPLFCSLFDRLAGSLGLVLDALEEHGRQYRILANVVPLRPEYFRSECARQMARASRFRSHWPVSGHSPFRPKLCAIRKIVAEVQTQARNLAREIVLEDSSGAHDRWVRLEVLQYDLNTCLQETTVVLKSFFCALPGNEVPLFRNLLAV